MSHTHIHTLPCCRTHLRSPTRRKASGGGRLALPVALRRVVGSPALRMVGSLEEVVGEADNASFPAEAPAAAEEEVIEYKSVKYLTRKEAIAIDEELMGEDFGWPLEALMELAGKSVADAIYDAYPPKNAEPHPGLLRLY